MNSIDPRANPLAGNPLRTRSDLQRAARDLVEPLIRHASPGGARIRLGSFAAHFPQEDAELEGFARPLWAIAPLAAGGGDFAHWDLWRRGLEAGSDASHPEAWIRYTGTSQTMVEQAAIGLALALCPDQLWEPLGARSRERLVDWLSLINRHEPVTNNWQFFRVLVNLGLEKVGATTDEEAVARSLDLIDSYYLGDGWYADGAGGARDHYIGWAIHAYGLIYAALRPNDPRSPIFRERARLFARDFEAWFDSDGGVIPFGRSLTYRFAAAAFWSALVFADEEALPWGRIKGLLLRHLRWWSRWPISDRDGVLSIGWTYNNPWMREEYNSAGSPYWALKSFLCLAAPESHPFWKAEEAPQEPITSQPQPHPGMLISRDEDQTVALSGGHNVLPFFGQGRAKYGRLAYSSVFAFSLELDAWGRARPGDSALIVSEPDRPARLERQVERCTLHRQEGHDFLYSRWTAGPGVRVHTLMSACTPWHWRIHRVENERSALVEESGFALGVAMPGGGDSSIEESMATVLSAEGCSAIVSLDGQREARVQALPPNANLVHPFSAVPVLTGRIEAGEHDLACAVYASAAMRSPGRGEVVQIPAIARTLLEELIAD